MAKLAAASALPAVGPQVARLAVAGLVGLLLYLLTQDCRTTSMRGISLGSWRSSPPSSPPSPPSVFEDAQQQQQSFCSQQNSSHADPNYIQHPVSLGLGRANMTTPISMWVHAPPDIVSDGIRSSGYWEPHETEQILAQLLKFEQARVLHSTSNAVFSVPTSTETQNHRPYVLSAGDRAQTARGLLHGHRSQCWYVPQECCTCD
jgi:hypothetical protein